jgi:hypothetical protein
MNPILKPTDLEFFDLAQRFRDAVDPEEISRLGDELGRRIFGDRCSNTK